MKVHDDAIALYRALDAAATTEQLNGHDERVFRGSIVKVFRSLDISQSRYTEVRRTLLDNDAITILQRGSRNNPSIIVLNGEPDVSSIVTLESLGLTTPAEAGIVFQELRDLKRRIGSIHIPDALVHIQRELQELDNRITKIEQQTQRKGDR
ncbi:MAG TPA: hypothetical protein VGE97_07545 [Nitrososphaera sp.]|jgi:hypothetical protein